MAGNNEDLYQALFTKKCSSKKEAKKHIGNDKVYGPFTKLYYSLLAKYGGEPFSERQFGEIIQNTRGILLNPGSTAKSILEKLVGWEFLHKLV